MQTTWFVATIMLFYLLFFVIYKIASKGLKYSVMLILALWVINIIAFYNFKFYRYSSIAWTRLPVFSLGVIAELQGNVIIKKWNIIKSLFCSIALFFTVIFSFRNWYIVELHKPSEGLWLTYIFFVPGLLIMLTEFSKRLPKLIYSFLAKIGDVSLEMYMLHVFLLRFWKFYNLYDIFPGKFCYVLFPVFCSAVGIFLHDIINKIQRGEKKL